jgi:hypothetical protein
MNRSSTVGMPSSRSPPPGFVRRGVPRAAAASAHADTQIALQPSFHRCRDCPHSVAHASVRPEGSGVRTPSISSLLPRLPFPLPTGDASTRSGDPCGFTALAVSTLGFSSNFCGITSPRRMGLSPSPPFGPSRLAPLLRPVLTSRSTGLATRVALSGAKRDLPG